MCESRLHKIFDNNPEKELWFRRQRVNHYAATEVAYIERYLKGEESLKGSFSEDNLKMFIEESEA